MHLSSSPHSLSMSEVWAMTKPLGCKGGGETGEPEQQAPFLVTLGIRTIGVSPQYPWIPSGPSRLSAPGHLHLCLGKALQSRREARASGASGPMLVHNPQWLRLDALMSKPSAPACGTSWPLGAASWRPLAGALRRGRRATPACEASWAPSAAS